jgi:hypothetical protein
MGHAVVEARGCEGVQEVFSDEATDETRGTCEIEPSGERERFEFWHSTEPLRAGFWHSFGTVA